MLSRTTIDQVNDLPLDQVISKYVELKGSGRQLTGKSPFTDEKTGSFQVSLSKGCWKCFSTGKGGSSPVKFVMLHKNLEWIEAVKLLAAEHDIPLEYDDSEKAQAYVEKAKTAVQIHDINASAMEYFISNIDKIPEDKRRASKEMYERFSIGYAPEDWSGLMNNLLSKGYSVDQLIRAGLVVKSTDKDKIFDFFRGRIIFPIFSTSGKVLGFSGRDITTPVEGKSVSKYMNTKDSDVYSKSNTLLGLYQSIHGIREKEYVNVTEGNFNVSSFHSVGMDNIVAHLGSAFTKEQAQILKKYTSSICLCVDNDAAGKKKIEDNTVMLLELGFTVQMFISDIEGQDPDDYVQKNDWSSGNFVEEFNQKKQDAVEYLAELYFTGATSIVQKSQAESKLTKLLSCVADAQLRNAYILNLSKKYKVVKASVEKSVSTELATRNNPEADPNQKGPKLPSYLKEEDHSNFKEFGFYSDTIKEKIGYYFPGSGVGFERISNFIITPMFQIRKQDNSKRIVQIRNAYVTKVIEISNKAFVSPQMFEEIVMNYGNFDFTGSKKQYQRIRSKLLAQFPMCDEITTLGWQTKGFYAFADGIIDDGFRPIDKNGMCHYNEEKFFLPAFSSIYSDAQEEDDMYEADRFFRFRPSSITMENWTSKMIRVHGENGMWSALHVIASIYRDFIFSIKNYFPILFNFGLPQTGKSTCARSVNSIFFGQQAAFLLPSGTPVSFNRRLARVKNAVVWFDEYTNAIDEKRFQSLKGSYDGTGHEKGVMSNDNKTISTKINSAPVISGQFLPTRDGNSLFTRCMILYFTVKPEDRSIEDLKEFDELNEWERKGLSNLIVEIVKYRDYFTQNFPHTQFEMESKVKADLMNEEFEGRVMQNWTLLMTIAKLMIDKLRLPFTFEEVYKSGLQNILKQSEQVSDSNDLASYWKMIEYLSFQHQIRVKEDYKVKEEIQVKVREGREGDRWVDLGKGEKVLYLKLTKIHMLYMEAHRKQTGENGVPEQSIKSYIKSSKAFIGNIAVVDFDGLKTSAYAFRYDMLGITLKGVGDVQKDPVPAAPEIKADDLPF